MGQCPFVRQKTSPSPPPPHSNTPTHSPPNHASDPVMAHSSRVVLLKTLASSLLVRVELHGTLLSFQVTRQVQGSERGAFGISDGLHTTVLHATPVCSGVCCMGSQGECLRDPPRWAPRLAPGAMDAVTRGKSHNGVVQAVFFSDRVRGTPSASRSWHIFLAQCDPHYPRTHCTLFLRLEYLRGAGVQTSPKTRGRERGGGGGQEKVVVVRSGL